MKNVLMAAVAVVAGLGAGCVAEVDGEDFEESESEVGPRRPYNGNGCGDSLSTDSVSECVTYKTGLGEIISQSTACAYMSRVPGETVLFSFTPDPGFVPSISFNSNPQSNDLVHGGGCAGITPTYVPSEETCRAGVMHGATGQYGVWNGTACVLPSGGGLEGGGGMEGGGR